MFFFLYRTPSLFTFFKFLFDKLTKIICSYHFSFQNLIIEHDFFSNLNIKINQYVTVSKIFERLLNNYEMKVIKQSNLIKNV